MCGPTMLEPGGFYDGPALQKILGLRRGSLDRGRLNGELRFTRRGGRILYLGAWVQLWLTGDEKPRVKHGSAERAVTA